MQSCISIECSNNELGAQNRMAHLKTEFVRFIGKAVLSAATLLRLVFSNVSMQDFSAKSSIGWSRFASAADKQLYAKYGLPDKGTCLIENTINQWMNLEAVA